MNGIDPAGLMSLLTPDKLARKTHKIINPMSTERIITELAAEKIERIKTEYGEDNATIERLEALKQHMEEKGLPSAP